MEWVGLAVGHLSTSTFHCNKEHGKTPQNPQTSDTSSLDIHLAPEDPRLGWGWGSSSFKELCVPASRGPVYFMSRNIKSNSQPCHILVDTGARVSTLNPS